MYNNSYSSRQGCPAGRYTATPVPSQTAYNYPPGSAAIRRQGSMNRIGSSNSVYGSMPYGMQQQQQRHNWTQQSPQQMQQQQRYYAAPPNGGSMARARSTPPGYGHQQQQQQQQHAQAVAQSGGSGGQMVMPAGMKTYATTNGIPPEVESNPNVQYVRMNWEDLLGGKTGLQGLQVSMAPGNGDPNANRQIRIGMGGAAQPEDGSTPLRIVSFEPVANYSGLKEPTAVQPGQPKFSVYTGSPQGQGQGQTMTSQPQQGQGQTWGNVYAGNNRR